MPFFQRATGTDASHANFNDVAGSQYNENGENIYFIAVT
jgi:hypothetical protein